MAILFRRHFLSLLRAGPRALPQGHRRLFKDSQESEPGNPLPALRSSQSGEGD